ncbi:MAG: PD40 domain-containing protein [Bryobacteraceae bacterium]|nr:PD40 domain-containing protein [Bryobacteraceae bacterium]
MRLALGLAASLLFAQDSARLANVRQLTHGGQNAEAYWSPDGRKLVFQSTREPYACDQIFVMNAEDGAGVSLVSTGKGRTTCGYFLADGKHVLYASTHEAGDACPPPPDRSKGYVWAVYPGYDIYLATLDGKIVKKLTDEPGYDAEATVNWKTGRIVYTSAASGDLDLWTMHSGGGDKRRVTAAAGYDGGAFFSRDGSRLVWRANHPSGDALARYRELLAAGLTSPMKMEIYVADAGGRNARQLTSFGCASFAPTFTPDGKKILFSSNKHDCDGRRFELYLMNLDGTGLEQVTRFGGFTSFPEFSPDGKKLVFSSDRNATGRYEFNIFTADWQ